MSEHSPFQGEVGPERKIFKYSDIPLLYQTLGKACADAGILDEFYGCLDAGYEYVDALKSLKPLLADRLGLNTHQETVAYFRQFEIADEEDDDGSDPEIYRRW